MIPACSTNHGKIGESSRSSFLRAALHMALDRSGDTAQQHLAFSTHPFEGLSPMTASSSVTSLSPFSATRFLNAIIADSVSLFNVISFSHLPQGSSILFFRTTPLVMI